MILGLLVLTHYQRVTDRHATKYRASIAERALQKLTMAHTWFVVVSVHSIISFIRADDVVFSAARPTTTAITSDKGGGKCDCPRCFCVCL